jgi:hypothetical protein
MFDFPNQISSPVDFLIRNNSAYILQSYLMKGTMSLWSWESAFVLLGRARHDNNTGSYHVFSLQKGSESA